MNIASAFTTVIVSAPLLRTHCEPLTWNTASRPMSDEKSSSSIDEVTQNVLNPRGKTSHLTLATVSSKYQLSFRGHTCRSFFTWAHCIRTLQRNPVSARVGPILTPQSFTLSVPQPISWFWPPQCSWGGRWVTVGNFDFSFSLPGFWSPEVLCAVAQRFEWFVVFS